VSELRVSVRATHNKTDAVGRGRCARAVVGTHSMSKARANSGTVRLSLVLWRAAAQPAASLAECARATSAGRREGVWGAVVARRGERKRSAKLAFINRARDAQNLLPRVRASNVHPFCTPLPSGPQNSQAFCLRKQAGATRPPHRRARGRHEVRARPFFPRSPALPAPATQGRATPLFRPLRAVWDCPVHTACAACAEERVTRPRHGRITISPPPHPSLPLPPPPPSEERVTRPRH
jgi:hypothetical protein